MNLTAASTRSMIPLLWFKEQGFQLVIAIIFISHDLEHPLIQTILGAHLLANDLRFAHRWCHRFLRYLSRGVSQNRHPVPRHRHRFQRKKMYLYGYTVQQQGYNPFKILRQLHENGHGMSVLYEGFDAHLYGRLSYLLVRNTLYTAIYNAVKPVKPYNDLSSREKSWIGAFAGAVGAAVSHPFTVVSIRQILDTQIKQ